MSDIQYMLLLLAWIIAYRSHAAIPVRKLRAKGIQQDLYSCVNICNVFIYGVVIVTLANGCDEDMGLKTTTFSGQSSHMVDISPQ